MPTPVEYALLQDMITALHGTYPWKREPWTRGTWLLLASCLLLGILLAEITFRNHLWQTRERWQMYLLGGLTIGSILGWILHHQGRTFVVNESGIACHSPIPGCSWVWPFEEIQDIFLHGTSTSWMAIYLINERKQMKKIPCTHAMQEVLESFRERVMALSVEHGETGHGRGANTASDTQADTA